jgi:hypothetical protein
MRIVCKSFIDFTRASISGPPLPSLLCAPLASSSSPKTAYQTATCSTPSSLLLGAIHLERCKYPPAFPSQPSPSATIRAPHYPILDRSLFQAPRVYKPSASPIARPFLFSSSNTSCVFYQVSLLTSCDWSKLGWILVVVVLLHIPTCLSSVSTT